MLSRKRKGKAPRKVTRRPEPRRKPTVGIMDPDTGCKRPAPAKFAPASVSTYWCVTQVRRGEWSLTHTSSGLSGGHARWPTAALALAALRRLMQACPWIDLEDTSTILEQPHIADAHAWAVAEERAQREAKAAKAAPPAPLAPEPEPAAEEPEAAPQHPDPEAEMPADWWADLNA